MSTYSIEIEDESIELNPTDLKELDISATGSNQFHVLHNNESFRVEVIHSDFSKKQLSIKVDGNLYELKIKDAYDELASKMGLSGGTSQKSKRVKAPMPGLILDILVKKGEVLSVGTPLVVLGAMKMENTLVAEGEGVVKSVEVIKDDNVDKGQVLIEME